jgi:hypothetical protein
MAPLNVIAITQAALDNDTDLVAYLHIRDPRLREYYRHGGTSNEASWQ